MGLKVFALICLVAAVKGAVVPVHLAPAAHVYLKPAEHSEFKAEAPAHYEFEYSVNDPTSGDIKHQKETREDDLVKGIYSFLQPDGLQRIVEYSSSLEHGFNAIVRYEKPKAVATVAKIEPAKYVLASQTHAAPISAKLTYAPTSEVGYTNVPAISNAVYSQTPQYAYLHTPQVIYSHTPQHQTVSHVTYYSRTPHVTYAQSPQVLIQTPLSYDHTQNPQVLIQTPQVSYDHNLQDNQDNYQINRAQEPHSQVEYSPDPQTNPVHQVSYSQAAVYQQPNEVNYAPVGPTQASYYPGQFGRIIQTSKNGIQIQTSGRRTRSRN